MSMASENPSIVGFIGLGAMGSRMAANIAKAGFEIGDMLGDGRLADVKLRLGRRKPLAARHGHKDVQQMKVSVGEPKSPHRVRSIHRNSFM